MISLAPGTLTHGFRVLRDGDVPLLHAHYWKLRHEASGATLYYTDRDDGQMIFSVGFRTLPEDDTGVFHILEHACLDGSIHYRLKEPFVNLLKTSMAVDLNAMTYGDKTIYYFISTSEQDYRHMLSVYLDAVFHPLLTTDRRIFEKEGWHPEPDGEGGVTISGVVFNEMQGNETQPDYALWTQNAKQLFPDLPARFQAGGDPASIPDLTYEQFVETYRRFYTTENAVFYLSGDMALDVELQDIDCVLCDRMRTDEQSGIRPYAKPAPTPLQAPIVSPDGVTYYQPGAGEEAAGNTHLLLTCVLPADDGAAPLAMSLLCRYLADHTDSPLTRAVLDAGVGQDFSMGCMSDDRQPLVCFSLGKTDPEEAERFRQTILDTLAGLVRGGLDRNRLHDLIAGHKTDWRRTALQVGTGFRIMEYFIRAHVQYDDATPENGLDALAARLAEDDSYFEHLIERYILHSDHWAMTRCIPLQTVTAERGERMAARCAAEAARLASIPGGYDGLVARNTALQEYLTAPDSPEAEASIPHLSPSDIRTDHTVLDVTEETIRVGEGNATSLFYETDADGMTIAGLLFDLSRVPSDDLFYVACLRDALTELPTETHTLTELSDHWVSLHTLLRSGLRTESNGTAYLTLMLDAPEERLPAAVALMDEYIRSLRFDRAALRELFSNATRVRDNMIGNGSGTALRLGTRCLNVSGLYDDLMTGETAYRRLTALSDRFDEQVDVLIDGMTRVWKHLTRERAPLCFLTGSASAYAAWTSALSTLSTGRDTGAAPAPRVLHPRRDLALAIPGEVNYCAELYDLAGQGRPYDARYSVIHTHLYGQYFWDEIRAKGGAYGASAANFRAGAIGYSSYRDPRVSETYAVFSALPDWLDAHIPTDDAIDAMIVSTMSAYFAPRSPLDLGRAALNRYLIGVTAADRRAEMEWILSTTAADFRNYAATLRDCLAGTPALRTALGNREKLLASGMFTEDEIVEF